MDTDAFPPLLVKNTFIQFDIHVSPCQRRATSCPARKHAQVDADWTLTSTKIVEDGKFEEMSYASTVDDSHDGCHSPQCDTDVSDDAGVQFSDSVCSYGSPYDLEYLALTHAPMPSWTPAEYFAPSYTIPCSQQCAQQVQLVRDPITTTMLRNIPQRFDRELLVQNLMSNGFVGSFDFVYLPSDFSTGVNLGYAFINFVSESEYMRFKMLYAGLKLAEKSPKKCIVCDAKIQGKENNVEFYRNSTVMNMDPKYHPLIFENAVQQLFPSPTRHVGPVVWKSGSSGSSARVNTWANDNSHSYQGPRGGRRRK